MCGSLLSKFKSADSKIDPAMVIFPEPRVKWSLPTNVSHKCLIANIDIILFVPLNSLMFNFWPHWIKRKSSLLEMFSRLTKVSRSALDSIIAGLPSRGPLQVIWLLISSLSFASASNRVFVRKICSAYAFILVQIKLGLVLKLRHCHHVYYFIYGIILSLDSVLRPNPKYHLLKQLFNYFRESVNGPKPSQNLIEHCLNYLPPLFSFGTKSLKILYHSLISHAVFAPINKNNLTPNNKWWAPSFFSVCFLIFTNYSPKWRWIVVDIYPPLSPTLRRIIVLVYTTQAE